MKKVNNYLIQSLWVAAMLLWLAACKEVPEVADADASFRIHKLSKDGRLQEMFTGDEVNVLMDTVFVRVRERITNPDGSTTEIEKVVKDYAAYVRFEATGPAYFKSLWTGDSTHRYQEYETEIANIESSLAGVRKDSVIAAINYGVKIPAKGFVDHTYTRPGTYQVTLIATNWAEEGSLQNKKTIQTKTLTIMKP